MPSRQIRHVHDYWMAVASPKRHRWTLRWCDDARLFPSRLCGEVVPMNWEPDRVENDEPALLIRIPRAYRPGMSSDALYEATRGHWKIGPRRRCAELAMAVVDGTVREVYVINGWHRAGTTPVAAQVHRAAPPDRWEFTGSVAAEHVRAKYIARSVKGYFPRGYQTPFKYVNCG